MTLYSIQTMSILHHRRTDLLGRDPPKSFLVFLLSIALTLGIYALGTTDVAQEWISGFGQMQPHFALLVFVVGGAVAAGNAYWNDGLVLSWLLVFGPVLAWLWNVGDQGVVHFGADIVLIGFATLGALVAGTLGYVVGRVFNGRAESETWYEPITWLLRVLVGQIPEQSTRWGILAGGLFVLASVVFYSTYPSLQLPIVGVDLIALVIPIDAIAADYATGLAVVLAWIGLAAWPAYQRNGLLVSWALLFGPIFGALFTRYVVFDPSGGGRLFDFVAAVLVALSIVLLLGTGGYLLGSGLRWVVDQHGSLASDSGRRT